MNLSLNFNDFLHTMRYAGVEDTQDIRQRSRLISMNTVYIYVSIMASIFCIIGILFYARGYVFAYFPALMCSLSIMVLNHFRYYRVALWMHFIMSGFPALLSSYLLGFDTGFFLYILAAPISILLFVDKSNFMDWYGAIFYYLLMFLSAYFLHILGYEQHLAKMPAIYFMFINFVFTAIFIIVFALNFSGLNEAYFTEIKEKNKVLEAQRDEITLSNDNLVEKNDRISDLVTVLNDKVKNNLQIISFFTELDTLNPPTTVITHLLLLQKSRVKVLDLLYAMIFEEKIEIGSRFSLFFNRYYKFLRSNYRKQIAETTTIDLQIPINTPNMDRKRFEMILLLVNEWHFGLLNEIYAPTNLPIILHLSVGEGSAQQFELIIKVAQHPTKALIPNKNLMRFRQPNTTIALDYDAESEAHIFNAKF